jgi:hypothetical protein
MIARSPRFALAAFLLLTAAMVAGVGAALTLREVGRSSWAYSEPTGNPEFGISFDCDYLVWLMAPAFDDWRKGRAGGEREAKSSFCAQEFEAMVVAQGFRHVRLPAPWNQIEVQPGRYDFEPLDALFAVAERHGVGVLLTVGMRAPRHPEFYIPAWLQAEDFVPEGGDPSTVPEIREAALAWAEAVVERYAASPALEAWQAENEPYKPTARAHNWVLNEEWVADVMSTIRGNDPRRRPIVITHSSLTARDRLWEQALRQGDIFGQSVYPRRWFDIPLLERPLPSLMIGPLAPNFPAQADLARRLGKRFWICELQAEPWESMPTNEIGGRPPKSISPGALEENITFGRRSGASRVYLWGAEWWHARARLFGDGSYERVARAALAGGEN